MTVSLSVTTPRSRAAYLGPERRRPQVLDAALALAAEDGLSAVTMGAIADRMQVSRPVVYACFAGRHEVVAALVQRESELALHSLFVLLPPPRTGSIEQMFVDGFRCLITAVEQRPWSWRLIYANEPDPALAPAISFGRNQVRARITEVMRPLLERWRVADLDVEAPLLADVFLAICETAVQTVLTGDDDAGHESLSRVFGRAAYRAVRAVPEPSSD